MSCFYVIVYYYFIMQIKNKRIFITGGAGFIGTNLSEKLVEDNKVISYDNLTRNALKYSNLEKHTNFTFIKGDILDKNLLFELMKNIDFVIHLAAIAGVSNYSKYPIKTMEVNFMGTKNILEVAKHLKLEKFVNFSTSEVYGSEAKDVTEKDNTPQGPVGEFRWTYAVSKLAAEHLCFSYYKENKLPIVSLRLFNIYGPKQIGEGAVQIFINQALHNKEITIYGNGSQIRAWCYIDDLIDIILLCLKKENTIGHILNIGNQFEAITIYELAYKIKRMCNSKSKIIYKKHPSSDIRIRIPDISKARKILKFELKVDLEKGLKKTVEWYKNNII